MSKLAIGGVLAAALYLVACAADPAGVDAASSPPGKPFVSLVHVRPLLVDL